MTTDTQLVDLLKNRQAEAALTDGEMAERLGVSRTLWRRVSSGERGLSLRVVRGAVAAFPDLATDVLIFLRSD